MSGIKIRVFKGGDSSPATTITIPGGIFRLARRLVPSRAVAALRDEGIELEELARLSENPEARGQIIEIEDHEKQQRTVISIE